MLAKYFAPLINPGGSLVLFSGVHAFKLNVGYLGVGITNGAVDFLTRWLAVELAAIRSTRFHPGSSIRELGTPSPPRRIGTAEDVADATLFAMNYTFMTGMTLKVDGGEPLI
jgi:NAD(P)-dependent dehydrogenase (short-subunit alcohol dehydrogenase family)